MRVLPTILLSSLLVGLAPAAKAQEAPKPLPTVIQHDQPIYPPLARQARIEGDVRVEVTTNGESVVSAVLLSGHPLLTQTALDNVRLWKFATHDPGTFLVTFRYRMQPDSGEVRFLELPGIVDLETPVPLVSIYYGNAGLGRWKAQLKSAKGVSRIMFDLLTGGPEADGVWLEGRLISKGVDDEEIEFGYSKDDFIAFTVMFARPDKKRLKAFFVGKMNKDKIEGTFVDETGLTGEWTAARVSNNIPPS